MSVLFQKILNHTTVNKLIGFGFGHKRQFFVMLLCILMVYVFISLLSYNPSDPAWSQVRIGGTNATQETVTNVGGAGGAYLADWLFTFLGQGAWLALLWLAYEGVCLIRSQVSIMMPLRIFAYLFLWVCLCTLGYAFAEKIAPTSALSVGGVVGYELFRALSALLTKVGAIVFCALGVIMIGFLMIDKPNRRKDDDTGPIISTDAAAAISVNELLHSLKTPAEPTVVQAVTPSHPKKNRSMLERFLVQTGIKENELRSPQEPVTLNPVASQRALPSQLNKERTITSQEPVAPVTQSNDLPQATARPVSSGWLARENQNSTIHTTQTTQENTATDTQAVRTVINDKALDTFIKKSAIARPEVVYTDENTSDNSDEGEAFGGVHINFNPNKPTDSTQPLSVQPQTVQPVAQKPAQAPTQSIATQAPKATNQAASQNAVQDTVNQETVVERPDIHDDKQFAQKSFAMQTAKYRQSLTPIPSLDLLDPIPQEQAGYSREQLIALSELLQIKLGEFGISATVMNVVQGPIVTSFEVELAAGVKASKVTNIAKDLARSLSMMSLRVVEVIAGKPYIGIEIPNKVKQIVKLKELLSSNDYQQGKHEIAMAMGKGIDGRVVIADLAKAPHMLVAGTTGSGKSVLVNAMLLSMLLKYTPDELRLILIDPKMLELANYGDIPHLLTPVVTDMTEAASALSWCVGEMERRYQLMAAIKVRKLSEFNKKVKEANANGTPLLDPLWRPNDSVSVSSAPRLTPLPLIVVVADEFADMMMQVGKQAEDLITRLAQKSRAAGIHLILATQRPSVDVITGLIKANIPSRAALRVNSKVDSRTILDEGGAEDMLGHGDMLFLAPSSNEPIRVHGAYVTDEEVNDVCDAWRERGAPNYIETVTTAMTFEEGYQDKSQDPLYDEALSFVIESGKTSISAVQRKLSIGYNRAANIIEAMEQAGVLSKPDSSGRRILL